MLHRLLVSREKTALSRSIANTKAVLAKALGSKEPSPGPLPKASVFALAALSLAVAATTTVAHAENTLRWGVARDVPSLDPNSYGDTFTIAVLSHVYEGLVRYNEKMQIEPALATSWKVLSPTVWQFKLRKGVKFDNGDTFTADDVIASLNRLTAPSSPVKSLPAYRGAKKIDDYTVDIDTTPNYPLLLNDLTNSVILDAKWMKAHNALQPTDVTKGIEGYASTHMNGTGPFKLVSRKPGQQTVFAVNKNWWDTPKHNIDRIIMTPIASPATRLAALLSGQIDFTTDVPLQDVPRLQASGKISLLKRDEFQTIFFFFNNKKSLYASDAKGNPFNDIRVRKAMYEAIDMKAIHTKIMHGLSRITGTIVSPAIPGYVPALDSRLPYDPKDAKALLAAAGYPHGFSFAFVCENDSYVNEAQLCQAVSAMWARIGLKPSLDLGPTSIQDAKYEDGHYDVGIEGWANEPPLDSFSILEQMVHARTGNAGSFNFGGWSVPGADALIDKASHTIDRKKRLSLQAQALQKVKDDIAFLPLHQEMAVWAVDSKIKSMFQGPDSKPRLWYATMK